MGDKNFMGGLLGGMAQSMQKQQEQEILKSYRDAQVALIKQQAKHEEAKVDMDLQKFNLFKPIIQGALAGQGQPVTSAPAPPQVPPVAQATPQLFGPGTTLESRQAAAQQTVPQQMAAMNPGGGMVQISPAGQKSAEFNNAANMEFRPWQEKYGASMGRDGRFGQYPTPEHGLAASVDRVQQIAKSGATVASAIQTWSPTFTRPDGSIENPNTQQRIGEISKALNVSPDTPLANVPIGPFMNALIKGESPTQINPAVYGEYASAPIGQTIGMNPVQYTKPGQQQQAAIPTMLNAQTNPQQFQPVRTIDQSDALGAAWKWLTGAELKDKKFDYRIAKNGDIIVLQEGQVRNRIPGGPNISWHNLPNGGFIALDATTTQPVAAFPIPEMVKSKGQTPEGVKYEHWEPKGGGGTGAGGLTLGGTPAIPGVGGGGIPAGGTVTEYPGYALPGTVPETIRTKHGQNEEIIKELDILKLNYKPAYLGLKGVASNAMNTASGVPGLESLGDPSYKAFKQIYDEMLGNKLHQRGGSALTQQEIMYIKNTLPQLGYSPELFASGIEAAKLLLRISNFEMLASHLTPDKAKYEMAATKLRDQYLNEFKPIMEKGLKQMKSMPPGAAGVPGPATPAPNYRYNPSTGKLEASQ